MPVRKILQSAWLLVLSGLACAPHPDDDLLVRAYQLGQQYQWQDAMPLVRPYLLAHPDSAAAHYLWGSCHLHDSAPALEIAKGEFETALALFSQSHEVGPLKETLTPGQFEAQIHQEAALVYMRWVREASLNNVAHSAIEIQINMALDHVRKARALTPESKVLEDMETTLLQVGGLDTPAKSTDLPGNGPAPPA